MARKNNSHSARTFIAILLSSILAFASIFAVTYIAGIGRMDYQVLDDTLSVDVIHSDGTVEHSKGSSFPPARFTDTIQIHVPLTQNSKLSNAAVCFRMYNCIIHVSCGDTVLYSYGEERIALKRQIGNLTVSVPVPEEAWGNALLITAIPQEENPTTGIHNVLLMSALNARMYPLVNNQFESLIFLTLTVVAQIALVVFAVLLLFGYRRSSQGFFLALFLFLVGCWYLGYQGLFYVIFNNVSLTSNIEYPALYALPIPFLAYVRRENLPKRFQQIMGGMELLFIMILVAVTILYRSPLEVNYLNYLNPLRGLILFALVVSIILLLLTPKKDQYLSQKILSYGLIITMTVAALETIRFILTNEFTSSILPQTGHPLIELNYTFIMILIFLSVLVSSYFLRQLKILRVETEQKQLSKLAYTDPLTGIPNRQDCLRKIETIDLQDCAVLFLDANDLKMANDCFGHNVGDELLRQIAHALKKAMEGQTGLFGRYGGDEFVACLNHVEDAEFVKKRFFWAIEEANQGKCLPFPISVACGFASYQEIRNQQALNHPPTVQDVIHLADQRMYENKQQTKQKAK